MHVLIIGAGLGGLTLAQTLRKQGISFEVFERDEDENGRFQGWAIALHTIIDEFLAALPSDMPDLKQSTDHLAPLNLRHQFAYYYGGREGCYGLEDSPETPFIRAERSRLRKWLLTDITVNWGKALTDITQDDEGVSVTFKDGTTARGDIAVGADGVYSPARQHLLQRPSTDLLHLVPLMAIVGELDLSGDAFKRQLGLGHSAYNLINPELGFIGFVGLHYVFPDGQGGRFYWMFMQPDTEDITDAKHWLQTSSQQEKLDHVRKTVRGLPLKLREIFELTPPEGVRKEPHIWRDLELDTLPSSRVALLGDAAHAMTPSRGEGAFHAFIDAMKLSKTIAGLQADAKYKDINAVKAAVGEYHTEMLRRGTAAVRASRSSYQEAKKRAETGEHFTSGMKPLSIEPIVLAARG
ncbi:FAD/NAD(P)-binding domain-containing protein [Lentithecium fluviatile CBS 122367]|uniref:FAD/NAD(P)-binding domain-containing protein n=1 Tax=Lentithecium fluviatile CBS 122367 TaxID=1168545 RepID=A0A6G1IKT6_9PLEO|nr:FAD/NAD(P)-binding domain-containing protein [Lentithecium fluviatile CBS 122367]